MNAEEIKAKFEEMVAAGTTNWTKQTWDSIGVEGKKENKTFLADYPRSKGITGDVVHIVVNGTQVSLHGTSNMTDEERKQYNASRGSGSGTPRSSAVPSTTSVEREKYYNDLQNLLTAHPEIKEIESLLDDLCTSTFHPERYYFKGYKKVSKDWLCFSAEDGSRFENPEGHVTDFLAEGRGFAPAISADKLPKILELAKENDVEIC